MISFRDFKALYGDKFKSVDNGEKALKHIQQMMEVPFSELSEEHRQMLDKITINSWELIQANSGGHKCITNISGLNYLGRSTRPPKGKTYGDQSEDSPTVKFTKMIAGQLQKVLKEKIQQSKGDN